MAIIEGTPRSLVLRLGSTTLTLDKDSDKAVLQRRLLFWTRRPIERRMSQIVEVTVDKRIDRASGVELCKTKLVMAEGDAWVVPIGDDQEAMRTFAALRNFLDIAPAEDASPRSGPSM